MANYVLPKQGVFTNTTIPSKSSTAYVEGELLYNDGTNDIPATTTTQVIRSITREAKTSASNTNPINVCIPRDVNAWFEMVVGTGTIAAADVGKSYDLASSTTVNASSQTYNPVTLQKFLTTTKGLFSINFLAGTDNI